MVSQHSVECFGRLEHGTRVHLTGGLGNQLFQLSAGLLIAGDSPLELVADFGRPRSFGDEPDVSEFLLPENVHVISDLGLTRGRRRLANACIQYLMSSTVRSSPLYSKSLTRTASWAASVLSHHRGPVVAQKGTGYDPSFALASEGSWIIGYSQTYKFASEQSVRAKLGSLRPRTENQWVSDHERFAAEEDPLVVHVRLGDYRLAPAFGIPSKNYVAAGIRMVRRNNPNGRLWLFSDEPEAAWERLPADEVERGPRVVSPIDESVCPAAVMQVFRLGRSFVLTNSSFGWWGAFLAKEKPLDVVAPSPWFRSEPEPSNLIPRDWQRIESLHEDLTESD